MHLPLRGLLQCHATSILGWWSLLHWLFDRIEYEVNHSRLHSIKWLGHIATASTNVTGIVAAPKTLDIQLVTAGAKKVASRWTVIPPTQNGCYRLVSLWFSWYATSAWWRFETSWKCFTFMCALGAGQIDADSTAGHAICGNSLGHHKNCLQNMRKLPYDHLVLAILTCIYIYTIAINCIPVDPPGASPSVSWLVPCVGFLASRQQKKSTDLTWTNEAFPASQNKMLPFRSIRRRLQTKGLSGSISSNIWLRFWVLTRSNDWASLGTACTQAKILQTS